MVIVETTVFTKLIGQLMDDDHYRELQELLIENPEIGDLIGGQADSAKSAGKLPDGVSGVV
jgi:hypothetical protein